MKAWHLILFFICLNLSGYVIANLMADDIIASSDKMEMPYTIEEIQNQFSPFSFSVTNIALGVLGAGIAGLIGLLLKQGTFAIYAVVIWLVGTFLNIASWVIFGFPKFMVFLLAGTGLDYLSYVFTTLLYLFFFWFLAETLAQRPLTH